MDSTMARPSTWVGDNSAQPEVFSVIDNTPAIQAEAALLESNGVVVWFDRDRCASTNEIATAIVGEIGALTSDVVVVLHFREKYLVRFVHKHHAKISSPRREVPFGDMKPHLRAWFVEAHDGDQAVRNAIGSGCSLDYVEPASKLKTATKVLALWA
ncbi:hypothetical protein ZWY2020_058761 [Hordeum vulgare]|nr:hypothetical protein ZWY2020_058761 [Hordeum vulgare]